MTDIAPILRSEQSPRTTGFVASDGMYDNLSIADLHFNQMVDSDQKQPSSATSQTKFSETEIEKTVAVIAATPDTGENSQENIEVDLVELETALANLGPDQPLPKAATFPALETSKSPNAPDTQNLPTFPTQRAPTDHNFTAPQDRGANNPPTRDLSQPSLRGSKTAIEMSVGSQATPTSTAAPDSAGRSNPSEKLTAASIKSETASPTVSKAQSQQSSDIATDQTAKKQALPSTSQSGVTIPTTAPASKSAAKEIQRDTRSAITVDPATPSVSREKTDSTRETLPRQTMAPMAQITPNPNTIVAPAIKMSPNMALLDLKGRPTDIRNLTEVMTAAETSLRQATSSQAPQLQPTQAQASQDARHIAQQLAAQLSKQSDGTTVIRLNPDELGPVRMSLRNTDGIMALTILAERPETAEIMRRNIGELAQEFNALGYTNLSFDFGDGGAAADSFGRTTQPQHEPNAVLPEPDLPATQQPNATRDARLDIRL